MVHSIKRYIFAKLNMKNIKPTYLITFFILISGLLYLYFFDPTTAQSSFLRCPLNAATNLKCPGCGAQRATHHLLHLHFKKAFALNPLFVSAIPFIMFGFYLDVVKPKSAFWLKVKNIFFSKTVLYILIITVVLFTITRNIPQ